MSNIGENSLELPKQNVEKVDTYSLYDVEVVNYSEIKEWLLQKHYAKSIPSVRQAFGLFDKSRVLQGVCCYGQPANNNNNMLGSFNVLELVRLVVNEGLPKNALSYFVGQTFNLIEKPKVLISYADRGRKHHGYIYQATNWMYTGLGNAIDSYIDRDGNQIHSRIMSDYRKETPELTRAQIAENLGWTLVKADNKFRYFYFLGNKKEKKEMLKALLEKYLILPYPKGDNVRYNADYQPNVQLRLL